MHVLISNIKLARNPQNYPQRADFSGRICRYHCHPYSHIWIPTFRFLCLTYIVRFDNHFCAHLNYLHMISCCQLSKYSGHSHRPWILILNLGLNIVHIDIDSLSRINVNLLYCSLVRDQYTIHPLSE